MLKMLRYNSELILSQRSPEICDSSSSIFRLTRAETAVSMEREPCSSLQHAIIKYSVMNLGSMLDRRRDRYIDAGRKTPLSLTAIFLVMPKDLRCHLGDMGHHARATGDEAPSCPWSLGTTNEEGREAILREISLKQLRWLDWHTRALLVC
ncbi:hypothetical protein KOW79_012344 [Hemibagrus wyckioides]|uniref:Uncharacterized protein n=1 Tax=Hemibagrus wyckioides TaxID=337641 RepID=A0A9D3NNA0_9TELE|nr:hypothetical protein KOW79_012344 [Hemibagrus wyckioides]